MSEVGNPGLTAEKGLDLGLHNVLRSIVKRTSHRILYLISHLSRVIGLILKPELNLKQLVLESRGIFTPPPPNSSCKFF